MAADLSIFLESTTRQENVKLSVHPRDLGTLLNAVDRSVWAGRVKIAKVTHPGGVTLGGETATVQKFVSDMRKAGLRLSMREDLASLLLPLMETMVSAPDQFMLAAGPLRSFTRSLDRMMVAANDIVETAEKSGYDRIEIGNTVRAWSRQLGTMYGDFAQARERMYFAAKASSIPTKRFSKTRPKKDFLKMRVPALANDTDRIARGLPGNLKKAGNKAVFLLKNLDRLSVKWVKKTPESDQEAFREDAGAILAEFCDLRDLVGGYLFGAMTGIVQRLDAISILHQNDRFGEPPRTLKVPSPSDVMGRAQRDSVETEKQVSVERVKPNEDVPEGIPGRKSSGIETVTVGGKTYIKQRKPLSAYKGYKSGEGSKWQSSWSDEEVVMGLHIPGADPLFEEIVTLEHRRAAGEYVLDNGKTVRPTEFAVRFLRDMGFTETMAAPPPKRGETAPIRSTGSKEFEKMSGLRFEVIDMRGKKGFPEDDKGIVYLHKAEYKLKQEYTNVEKVWKRTYVIRTDHRDKGWRIDEMAPPLPTEAVPGLENYYKTPQVAAKKLAAYLKNIVSKGIYPEAVEQQPANVTEDLVSSLQKEFRAEHPKYVTGKVYKSKKIPEFVAWIRSKTSKKDAAYEFASLLFKGLEGDVFDKAWAKASRASSVTESVGPDWYRKFEGAIGSFFKGTWGKEKSNVHLQAFQKHMDAFVAGASKSEGDYSPSEMVGALEYVIEDVKAAKADENTAEVLKILKDGKKRLSKMGESIGESVDITEAGSVKDVEAYLSRFKVGDAIDAWGLARAVRGLEPIRAEQILDAHVKDGSFKKDGKWYEKVESSTRRANLTEGYLSRKKLYDDLKDIDEKGVAKIIKLPTSYEKLYNEIFGKNAMIFVSWVTPEDRKKGEVELKQRGHKIHRYDDPNMSKIQVSYFKGWHWDESSEHSTNFDESAKNIMAKLAYQQKKKEREAVKSADPKLVAQARELGKKAFHAGVHTPAQDKDFLALLKRFWASPGPKTPVSVFPYQAAWRDGWSSAHVKSVESSSATKESGEHDGHLAEEIVDTLVAADPAKEAKWLAKYLADEEGIETEIKQDGEDYLVVSLNGEVVKVVKEATDVDRFVDALSEETREALDTGMVAIEHVADMAFILHEEFGIPETEAKALAKALVEKSAESLRRELRGMKKRGEIPGQKPGKRFANLVKELEKKGADDPGALAAWIGRKKYGKEKMAKMAAAGRRRATKVVGVARGAL